MNSEGGRKGGVHSLAISFFAPFSSTGTQDLPENQLIDLAFSLYDSDNSGTIELKGAWLPAAVSLPSLASPSWPSERPT